VVADLKTIYKAATAEGVEIRLESFATKWDEAYLSISRSWRKAGIKSSRSSLFHLRSAR
jgi:transposase-like protein